MQVALTLVAGVDTVAGQGEGADEPGEVDGDLVPAPMVRELAHTFGLMPRPDTADGSERDDFQVVDGTPPAHASSDDASSADGECDVRLAALRDAELAAAEELLAALSTADRGPDDNGTSARRAALARLLDTRRLIDTALAERPRIAVTDRLSGALLALTDSTQLRAAAAAGRGLGPPPGTGAYQPTDPLYRFVRLRDDAAVSPAAARPRGAATWTTRSRIRTGPPHTTISPACASTTTGSPTRPRAGGCTATPTAAWSGPFPAASASAPARLRSAPTTAAPRRFSLRSAPGDSATTTPSPRSGPADLPHRERTSRSDGIGCANRAPEVRAGRRPADSRVSSGLFSLNTRRPHLSLNTAISSPLVPLQHLGAAGGRRPSRAEASSVRRARL